MHSVRDNKLARILFIVFLPLAFFAWGEDSVHLLNEGMSYEVQEELGWENAFLAQEEVLSQEFIIPVQVALLECTMVGNGNDDLSCECVKKGNITCQR